MYCQMEDIDELRIEQAPSPWLIRIFPVRFSIEYGNDTWFIPDPLLLTHNNNIIISLLL